MKNLLKPKYLAVLLLICLTALLLSGCLLFTSREKIESRVLDYMERKYEEPFVVVGYSLTDSFGRLGNRAELRMMTKKDYDAASEEEKDDWSYNYQIMEAFYSSEKILQYSMADCAETYYLHDDYDQTVRSISGQYFEEFTSSAEIYFLDGDEFYRKEDTLTSLKKKSEKFQLVGYVRIFVPESQNKSEEKLEKTAKHIWLQMKQRDCRNAVLIWVLEEDAYQNVKELVKQNKVNAALEYGRKEKNEGKMKDIAYWPSDGMMEE